ncbi:MAG: Yip1 family protein [bacterium]
MQKIFERVKKIILDPKGALNEVKDEEFVVMDFMKEYVVIVGAIPAASMFIGLIGRFNLFVVLMYAALTYGIGVLMVFVFGKIIDALASSFNATKNDLNAFKLSAYTYTPFFVAGIANINPALSFLSLVGLAYGLYILYMGTQTLMQAPQEKAVLYTVAAIVINVVISVILYTIAATLTGIGFFVSS